MMEGVLSPSDKESMVSSFLEIAVGQTVDTATQFLQATSWKIEEAIQLFYIGNEGGTAASSIYSPPLENDRPLADQSSSQLKEDIGDENGRQADGNEVRAPIPVRREVLYDNAIPYGSRVGYSSHEAHSVVPFRNFTEEMRRPGIWESEQGATSTADNSPDNLASLYRPPFALMHNGPFEAAKDAAKIQDKWFLVNVQSTKEFSSHMLNRDTWANEAVSQTISNNFIFWQVYDDTEEGRKVCTYYKLDSIPVILVIDPITGQKMRSWRGMVQPESLLEDLLPFMDGSPKDHVSLSHKRPRESSKSTMVFSSVPVYLDPPHHNWQQQQLPNHHQSGGGESDNNHFPPPLPPPPSGGSGGTATGSARPGSMAERARLAKMPQPEVALKCPRCESTNTKFCYFNNYSLTQPRHFCKTCRRYWTRGGALRSVPVGGGCRRNKKSKRNRSKSPAMNDHRRDGSSSAAGVTSTTTCTTGMIGHLILPPPQQLPFLPSLPHLSDYSSTDIALNFPGIQPPVGATGGVNGGIDMEFGIGTNTGGGGGGSILSARFAEQWRLQQVQHFPFLTGLDMPSGLYPFEGEGVVDPSGFTGSAATGHLGSKGSGGLTQVATSVKIEDNQGVNLSRNFLGIPGNDHYWGGNAWTDLSGFTSSSTSHLL